MSRLDTLERLEDRLSGELSWRKKEIVAFRSATNRLSATRDYFSRAGAVMLCAHWEGMLKVAVQSYIEHVFAQSLSITELNDQFVSIYFFKYVRKAGEAKFPGSEAHHIKLARKIRESLANPCNESGWSVKVEGNPSSEVLGCTLASIGLDRRMGYTDNEWNTFKVFLDSQILNDRHKIAHGERYPMDSHHLRERSNRIIDAFERLARLVLSAARAREYVRGAAAIAP